MGNQLFRQKSLERISSPEELHDYMRVTSPRLWMILAAIVVLLTGFIVYASTATMENTMAIKAEVSNYRISDENGDETHTMVTCTLPLSQMNLVTPGMKVRMVGMEGVASFIYTDEEEVGVVIEMEKAYLGLPDGTYDAELVLESTTPISFLWN